MNNQKGAIGIYIALLMIAIIVSTVLVGNSVLTRQIRLSREVAASERAFAAANTGYEHALFMLTTASGEDVSGEGEISYPEEAAHYQFQARLYEIEGERIPCVLASGEYRGETRRLFTGPTECDFISS